MRTWPEIAGQVKTLSGAAPRPHHVANCYRRFKRTRGPCKYKYQNCGRKASKVTKEVEGFLVRALLARRNKAACTSPLLQALLAKETGVTLSTSWIRKILARRGFRWLPRRQKRLYTAGQRKARVALAKQILGMSGPALRQRVSLAMGGVALAMPPTDPAERLNF